MTWKTDTGQLAKEVMDSLAEIRLQLGDEAQHSLTTLETFCSISLDILAQTNPSKLQRAAKNAELRSLIAPSRPK